MKLLGLGREDRAGGLRVGGTTLSLNLLISWLALARDLNRERLVGQHLARSALVEMQQSGDLLSGLSARFPQLSMFGLSPGTDEWRFVNGALVRSAEQVASLLPGQDPDAVGLLVAWCIDGALASAEGAESLWRVGG